jgi:hypothetical protein
MNKTACVACAVWVMAACGGGGDAMPDAASRACQEMGGSACFQLPTAPLQNRDGAPSALGCGALTATPAPAALTITGTVLSFGTSKPLPNAALALYSSASYATPFATATSAADGTYSMNIAAGSPDVTWAEAIAADYLSVYVHAFRFDFSQGDITAFNPRVLTPDNVESAALLVKEIWDPTVMVAVGNVYDCTRSVVMHAAVALSSTSSTRTFVAGAPMYYGAPGAVPLAVPPEDRGDTNDNGAFVAFHVPPGQTLYLQAWGFIDAAAQAKGEAGLTLIAEQQLHTVANGAANVSLWTR